MQFNTIDELRSHREDTLSPEDYDSLSDLEPNVAQFVLDEVSKSIATLEKLHYRQEKKTKTDYDKRLIASLETSIQELRFRSMDNEAETIQNILTTLLFENLDSKHKGIPTDKPTAKQNEKKQRKNYTMIFEKEFGLKKGKSKALATTLTTLLQ